LIALSAGDEFFVRYVPQSRYFQAQEFEVRGKSFGVDELAQLHDGGEMVRVQEIRL